MKTASGATAVQIVHKRGRRVLSIEHIGSAHTDGELAVLLRVAEERRHAGQLALDLDDAGAGGAGTPAVVEGTASLILWDVLAGIYDDLGLDRLGDGTFRALVLARVIERSFRMTKSDLAARPVFHRLEDSIQAHLTIVFAALAVSREAQARAGLSINRVLKILRPLRSATVTIGAQQVTAQPRIPAEARTLLNDLGWSGH